MHRALFLLALLAGCPEGSDDKSDEPSEPAAAPAGEAPRAVIVRPTGDGPWYSDQPIALGGTVSDPEDGPDALTVRWSTDEAGDLGVETPVSDDGTVSGTTQLDAGTWTLRLEVTDTDGNTATDGAVLVVSGPNTAPSCAITAPADGETIAVGEELRFAGTATDDDVSAGQLTVVWSSDVDGELRTSTPDPDGSIAFASSSLSIATHRVSLLVTDEVGAS
ncbi:MAG: hypothetical protein VX265_13015, partial [Myxococcota bacterium]|nr:hypothetical protein [Myxococcota bacterium]